MAGVPPDFVSWTGTLMRRPTATAAANHRFPPGLAWLVGSAMAAAVFTEVGLRGRCGSNRAEQRGAVSLSSSGGNNDDDDTAALLSSSWRTSHTRVLTLRYIWVARFVGGRHGKQGLWTWTWSGKTKQKSHQTDHTLHTRRQQSNIWAEATR